MNGDAALTKLSRSIIKMWYREFVSGFLERGVHLDLMNELTLSVDYKLG